MTVNRFHQTYLVNLTAALLGLMIFCNGVFAQNCPSKSIRMIVTFPPGGGADSLARTVAPKLTEIGGLQVIVDNRPGAAGNIGAEIVARSLPDGCTLLWGHSSALVVNPSLYTNLPFDTIKDFAPILLLGSTQYLLLVHSSMQANSAKDLVELVKKSKPGQFTYSSSGIGSPNHLAAEVYKSMAGIDIVHIPYKGGGPAVIAVLSGEVKMFFGSVAASLPQLKAGTLKALAVTGPSRAPEAPDIPTMQESGFPGFDVRAWYGVLAPAATPQNIVLRFHRNLTQILTMPEVRAALKREGLDIYMTTPQEFAEYIRTQKLFWAKVIKDARIKAE